MSKNLRKTFADIYYVANLKNKSLRLLNLKYMSKSPKYRKAIKEIALNLIKGKVSIDNITKRKLRNHTNKILKASRTSFKDHTVQSGGWLPWVLPVIASLLQIAL